MSSACIHCGTSEQLRTCDVCGCQEHLIDCGHEPQPLPISWCHVAHADICQDCFGDDAKMLLHRYGMPQVAHYMDPELREDLHGDGFDTDLAFLRAYMVRHEAEFDEEFSLN